MLRGSSIDKSIIEQAHSVAVNYQRVMVLLDSCHTHAHVMAELTAYAPLVAVGSYCVVFDTVVEYMPNDTHAHRPWGKGNNPMTATDAYLVSHPEFVRDEMIDAKLLISVAPKGYLKRVR